MDEDFSEEGLVHHAPARRCCVRVCLRATGHQCEGGIYAFLQSIPGDTGVFASSMSVSQLRVDLALTLLEEFKVDGPALIPVEDLPPPILQLDARRT